MKLPCDGIHELIRPSTITASPSLVARATPQRIAVHRKLHPWRLAQEIHMSFIHKEHEPDRDTDEHPKA
jgi:hypothetical protein